jgi:hypothetical protein
MVGDLNREDDKYEFRRQPNHVSAVMQDSLAKDPVEDELMT